MTRKLLLRNAMIMALLTNTLFADAQGTAINTTGTAAAASAMLDVASTASPFKGMLVPRMTTTNMNTITSPATGLMIYNTTAGAFYFYTGSAWTQIGAGTTLNNGTAGAQLYLTNTTTPFAVNPNPVSVSGDVSITPGGVTAVTNLPAISGASLTGLQNIAANSAAGNSIAAALGAATTGKTGTGSVVLNNAPAFVTPNLGTPSSIVLTNATALPLGSAVVGTLPVSFLTPGGTFPAENGSALTNLNGGSIATGTVPAARLGTGSGSATTFLNGSGAFSAPAASATAVTFLSVFNNGNVSGTGNYYAPLTGATAGGTDEPTSATVSFAARTITVAPIGCTFNQLSVASVVAPWSGDASSTGTGTEIFTLYKNGSATSLTCSITGMNYATLYSSGSSSDVTHTVAVSAGDMLSIQVSESNISALEEYTAILKCQ